MWRDIPPVVGLCWSGQTAAGLRRQHGEPPPAVPQSHAANSTSVPGHPCILLWLLDGSRLVLAGSRLKTRLPGAETLICYSHSTLASTLQTPSQPSQSDDDRINPSLTLILTGPPEPQAPSYDRSFMVTNDSAWYYVISVNGDPQPLSLAVNFAQLGLTAGSRYFVTEVSAARFGARRCAWRGHHVFVCRLCERML